MSLVFYDTETTGTKTFFDQILQFAAIKTDADFNEIDRFEIRSRLLPHVVPAPGAMRVTGVRPHQLHDTKHPSHYEMVRAVRAKLLEWSPGTFLGYNSLEFDENLLRQALYKTLHNPYLTNREGNTRTDVLCMIHACSLYAPDVLNIPLGDNGKPSFKLDRLAPANGFNHEKAHDALADVEATIHMCRLIRDGAPDIWSAFMRFSQKASVVEYIQDEVMFCLTEFYFNKPYTYLVTTIAQNKKNKAEWYVYDLSVDPDVLLDLSEDALAARLSKSPKPVRKLRSNASPALFSADEAPDGCRGKDCGTDELQRRLKTLQNNPKFCQQLIALVEAAKEEYPPSPHVEKQIYDGFFDQDEHLMERFHEVDWVERIPLLAEFKDDRLRIIAEKLIHLERPDLLDIKRKQAHHAEASRRLLGDCPEVDWMTLPQALEELGKLQEGATGSQLALLQEYDGYLRDRIAQAKEIIDML